MQGSFPLRRLLCEISKLQNLQPEFELAAATKPKKKREGKQREKTPYIKKFRMTLRLLRGNTVEEVIRELLVHPAHDNSYLHSTMTDALFVTLTNDEEQEYVSVDLFVHFRGCFRRKPAFDLLMQFIEWIESKQAEYEFMKQVELITDLRATGQSTHGFISYCMNSMSSESELMYAFMGHVKINDSSLRIQQSQSVGGGGGTQSKLQVERVQKLLGKSKEGEVANKATCTDKQQRLFDGILKLKSQILTYFEYIKLRFLSEVMLKSQMRQQKSSRLTRIKDWRRFQSFNVITAMMLMASIEQCRFAQLEQCNTETARVLMADIFSSANIFYFMSEWHTEFMATLRSKDTLDQRDAAVVHPHPSTMFKYTLEPTDGVLAVHEKLRLYNPWFLGIEYCLPALCSLYFAGRQMLKDDKLRTNMHSVLFMIGESGSGKSRLCGMLLQKFNGYMWQKKKSNFQNRVLEQRSVVIVDEFDCHALMQESTENEWKQRLDQESTSFCDFKGQTGSNCTKHVPFVVTSNLTYPWFKQNYSKPLLRRIQLVPFYHSLADFEERTLSTANDSYHRYMQLDPEVSNDQMCNLMLLLVLFEPTKSNAINHYYVPVPLMRMLVRLLICNRNSTLVRLLLSNIEREELYLAMAQYMNRSHMELKGNKVHVFKKLYAMGMPFQLVFKGMVEFTKPRLLQNSSPLEVISQLQMSDPLKDYGQYSGLEYLQGQDEIDLTQLVWMLKRLDQKSKLLSNVMYAIQIRLVGTQKTGGVVENVVVEEKQGFSLEGMQQAAGAVENIVEEKRGFSLEYAAGNGQGRSDGSTGAQENEQQQSSSLQCESGGLLSELPSEITACFGNGGVGLEAMEEQQQYQQQMLTGGLLGEDADEDEYGGMGSVVEMSRLQDVQYSKFFQ